MSIPPDWAVSVPSTPGVHTEPASWYQWQNLTQAEVDSLRWKLLESILQVVVQDITGGLLPGPAGQQLAAWADNVITTGVPIAASAITGVLTLAQLPVTVLTTFSTIAVEALTGVIPWANLPSTLLTTASNIAATAITGTMTLAQLPTSLLTLTSALPTGNLTGIIPWANLPTSLLTTASSIATSQLSGLLSLTNIPGLPASQVTSGTFAAPRMQPVLDAVSQGFGGTAGLDFSGLQSFLSGLGLGAVSSGIQSLINTAVGAGGSVFPWTFPVTFGGGANTLTDVGNAIAGSEQLGQQVLDTIVQQYTGSTATGHSIFDLQSALQQQPGTTLGGGQAITPALLPDITVDMSTGLAAVQQDAGQALDQLSAVVEYAEQESAQALGSFIAGTGNVANLAQTFAQGTSDQIVGALSGIPVVGSELADLYNAFTSHLTGLYNGWTGGSVTQADSAQVATAAQQAASQANQQSALINSIQTQLPQKYGGGGGGLSFQQLFSGGVLPAGFVALTPGTSVAYQVAINTAQQATTDTQAVSGVWAVQDNYAKLLILRSNTAGTTFHYALIQSNSSANNCKIGVVVGGVNTVLSTFGLPGGGQFVANYGYTFQATGRVLTLSGPNGLSKTVTDSGNVGSIGAAFRYGGYGLNGTSLGASGWGTPGDYTWNPPAGMAAGDQYEIVPLGAAGGGGGGVNAWGNGGGVGNFASLLATLGVTGGPAVGASVNVHVGAGGAAGNSEYYAGRVDEYYTFGGSTSTPTTYANYANPGGAGGNSSASYAKVGGGTQNVTGTGGPGGAASGGSLTGGGGASTVVNGDTFGSGASQPNAALVNGAAPAYNGYNGNNFGGGGAGCYSGSGQTDSSSWYDSYGDHFLGYVFGLNAQQTAGAGAPGAVWITPISRQLPGSIASWAFYDAAVAGPTIAQCIPAAWNEGTASTTWTNLATTTDQVTVTIGPSGMALVTIECCMAWSNTALGQAWMTVALSGANTRTAANMDSNNYSMGMVEDTNITIGVPMCKTFVLGGSGDPMGPLNAGATTFKMKYYNGGTGTPAGTAQFGPRSISVTPL